METYEKCQYFRAQAILTKSVSSSGTQEPIILTNPAGDSGPAKRSYSKDKKHSLCIQE